ncbi:MAG TPA: ABC-F family ATP-binding cassette domain-containing protein [Candidatus Olsenella excrementavium]|uniref:ABC-F family ATP-binding cassette domain-containing protein n=1 Tax=Candidatus Olsenella excrementavium TaxID=2838709 RepID=A0A9D1ZCS1_9ACTN|nr:ABC-F family ATP-binding cassette domain-containing protein [Candidatus Olsenella excrementavium]
MGILIGLEHVCHEWPGKRVLEDQTIGINEGERIGIVGRNGDGKSTLLEIVGHVLEPDSGTVTWRRGINVGYLGQADELVDKDPVRRAIFGDAPEYTWASDARIRAILDELVGDLDLDGLVGELSGGQRRRVDLCRVLCHTWDVILMDEPTNHLDLAAIEWLAGHLKRRWPTGEGALLVVTHDRWFLDEVCEHMWEVHDRRIEPFEGGYSAYIQQRVERERQAAVMEERRQNTLRKELNWLAHGAKARTSKPKFRVEAARALIANDPPLRNPLELKRLAVSRLGKQVIEMKDVSFAYPGGPRVIDGVSWLIGPGDRYGILGANGAGKSTLLALMTGALEPTSGTVKIGASVRFGFMSQHLDALGEKDDWRVLEVLGRYKRSYLVGGKMQSPTQLIERLGFEQRELTNFIKDLSGGQRRRLALLCVILEEPNVLVLDEPGNDLDTDMLAVMEDLLDSWPGTLLVVSHDRYLMERVTDDQFALLDGHVRHVPGGVDEYLRLLGEKDNEAQVEKDAHEDGPSCAAVSDLTNQERRELKKRFDAVSRRLEKTAGEPDRLRAEMAAVDASDYAALMAAQEALDACLAEREALEDEWLELSDRLGIE